MATKYAKETKLKDEAIRLNRLHPAGTKVRFWVGTKIGEGETGSLIEYSVLSNHTVVGGVRAEGPPRRLRSIAVSHIEAL